MKMSLKFFVAMILCCTVVHAQSPKYRPKYPRPTRPKQEEDQSRRLKTIAEWNQLDFEFPNSSEKDRAIEDGRFIQKNCLPLDVDVQFRADGQNRMFVTIPRVQKGIPITLGTFLVTSTIGIPITLGTFLANSTIGIGPIRNPKIKPYPNYDWHKSSGGDCDGITSVYRVMTDDCKRIWVLDTGKIGSIVKCSPQLLIFDLNTDQLIRRYRIPDDQVTSESLLVTPVLDITSDCQNAKAYLADITTHSLIVYDFTQDRSWKIKHRLFKNTPGHETVTVAGESFEFTDGIIGMALPKRRRLAERNEDNRSLFFHSLNGITENSVPLKILRNGTVFSRNPNSYGDQFKEIGNRGVISAAQAMDMRGNLFFGVVHPLGIACWDSSTTYDRNNIKLVTTNNETLQFASGVKVIKNFLEDEDLWVMTNRIQKYLAGTLDVNDANFRILMRPIKQLLVGKRCNNGSFPMSLSDF